MRGGLTPAVVMVCKNCGFIRFHSKVLLESLIPNDADEGGSDGE